MILWMGSDEGNELWYRETMNGILLKYLYVDRLFLDQVFLTLIVLPINGRGFWYTKSIDKILA